MTNPMEVLKVFRFKSFSKHLKSLSYLTLFFFQVRLQMNPNLRRGAIGEMRKIASEEGIMALWKGVGPAMTVSQLATYDESKRVKF
ncbi:unnamed protein product [Camellia sinensis]